MIRAAFRGTAREHLIAVALALLVAICCLLLTGVPAHGADQADGSAIRAYNPFNDPKPAVPAEMLSDKRLDRKVRVSVKSKGLNQFLADLSAKTGVKLSADPKVQAERPIICCNGRSLRDLLTEISGLYGYTWRAVPDRGGYRYDLFEDAPHMKLRTAQSRESARKANALLLEFTKKFRTLTPDDPDVKKFSSFSNSAYQSLFGAYGKPMAALISNLSDDLLARALEDDGVSVAYSELPSAAQTAMVDWIKSIGEQSRRWRSDQQSSPPSDPAALTPTKLTIRRAEGVSSGIARFEFSVSTAGERSFTTQWPSWQIRASDLLTLAGMHAEEDSAAQPLPDDVTISPAIPKNRLWLTAADILQAIADQSGRDVICDSNPQDQQPLMSGIPLGALVERLCREYGYACHADDSMLRLRLKEWYVRAQSEEPPAKLIESCWNDVEKSGRLSVSNLVALASLPPRQMAWSGFRDMPGSRDALRSPLAFRLWAALKDAKASAEGIAVSKLPDAQKKLFDDWYASLGLSIAPEKLAGATVSVTTQRAEGAFGSGRQGSQFEYDQINLKAGDEELFRQPIYLSAPLSDEDRRSLITARKAESQADIIKVLD